MTVNKPGVSVVRLWGRRVVGNVGVLVLVGLIGVQALAGKRTALAETQFAGVVVSSDGEVELQRGGSVAALFVLDLVFPGDRLVTGSNGRAIIRLTDDTLLEVGAGSDVVFDAHERRSPTDSALRLQLHAGQMRGLTRQAGSEYVISTPFADVRALAHGTSFAMIAAQDGLLIRRHAGALTVDNQGVQLRMDETNSLNDVRTGVGQSPESASVEPDVHDVLQPISLLDRQLRANRWGWLGRDPEQPEVSGAVHWVPAMIERYRERSPLPIPEPNVKVLYPLKSDLPEAVTGTATQPFSAQDAQGLDQAPLTELARLIRERQDAAAVNLARQLQPEYEGEPDFDVLYARALMNVGDYQEATFALERALMVLPRNIDARLTLAEAYLGLGNTRAARRQLSRLDNRTLSGTQQRRQAALEQRLLQQTQRQQRQTRLALSAELQYYTNINTGLHVDTLTDIDIVGPDVVVDDESKAKAAPATTIQASAERTTPISQRLRRTSQVGLTSRVSTFSDANNLGGVMAVNWQHDRGRRVGVQLVPSWNADGVQVTAAASGQLDDLVGPVDLSVTTAVTWQDEQQSLLTTLSASDAPSLGNLPTPWRVSLLGNISTASANNFLGAGAALQPRWRPATLYSLQFDLGYQIQAYLDDSALYNTRRRDQTVRAEVLVLRPWRDRGVFTGRLTAQNRFSNQSLYEFRGVELAVGYQHIW